MRCLRVGRPYTDPLSTHAPRKHRHYTTSQIPISNLEPTKYLPYPKLQHALKQIRRRLNRPLTLSEKLLYTHLRNPLDQELERGKSFLQLDPDRAACHDATATMAMLQFISAGLPKVALPTSIHSDHLIVAENGAVVDLENAKRDYSEVCLDLNPDEIDAQMNESLPGSPPGVSVPSLRVAKVRHWILEAWVGNYTYDHTGELCFVSYLCLRNHVMLYLTT